MLSFTNWDLREVYSSAEIVEAWLVQLFHYAYSFGGLFNWASESSTYALFQLERNFNLREEQIDLCLNLYIWGVQNNKSQIIGVLQKKIIRSYTQFTWKVPEVKIKVGLQILFMIGIDQNIKEKIYEELVASGKLDMPSKIRATLALVTDVTKLECYLDDLKKYFDEYNSRIDSDSPDEIDRIYKRAKIFSTILALPISSSLEFGKSESITDLIVSFFNPKKPLIQDTILYICPNHLKGFVVCFKNESLIYPRDTRRFVIKAIEAENMFLNSSKVIKGVSDQVFLPPKDRIGKPNVEYAELFEQALKELYQFHILVGETESGVESICQFDFGSFPIQGLLVKELGKTFPINLSLSQKESFRRTQNILFWEGSSFTSKMERQYLEKIFTNCDISLTVLSAEEASKADFFDQIKEAEYDILWISSHGEHEHYEPNLSSIELGPTEYISLREYQSLKNVTEKRRLIFLNTCEGGIQTQTAEFQNLGFPKLLTSENQDVLGHLWMIDSYIAVLYGILFGIGIRFYSLNFFESFSYATETLQNGIESIEGELKKFPGLEDLPGIVERQANFDCADITSWGSPVYYV